MKYVKTLGPIVAVVGLMAAFASAASATVTTETTPGVFGKYSGDIHSASTTAHFQLGGYTVICGNSTLAVTSVEGSTSGAVGPLEFTNCTPDTVTVLKKGGIVTDSATNTVTSTGAEVTVLLHRSLLGFPATIHCIFVTEQSAIGTLTEGANPKIEVSVTELQLVKTDSVCGEGKTAGWVGSYPISTPKPLIVD